MDGRSKMFHRTPPGAPSVETGTHSYSCPSSRRQSGYKTELCYHFGKGYCWSGDACYYAHGKAELLLKRPRTEKVKVKVSEPVTSPTPEISPDQDSVKSNVEALETEKEDYVLNGTSVGKSSDIKLDRSPVTDEASEKLVSEAGSTSTDRYVQTDNAVTRIDAFSQTLPHVCPVGRCQPLSPPKATFETLFPVPAGSVILQPSKIPSKSLKLDENSNDLECQEMNRVGTASGDILRRPRAEPDGQNHEPAPNGTQFNSNGESQIDLGGLARQLESIISMAESRKSKESLTADVSRALDALSRDVAFLVGDLRNLRGYVSGFIPWNVVANVGHYDRLRSVSAELSNAVHFARSDLKESVLGATNSFVETNCRIKNLESRMLQQERELVKNVTLSYSILEKVDQLFLMNDKLDLIKKDLRRRREEDERQRSSLLAHHFFRLRCEMSKVAEKCVGESRQTGQLRVETAESIRSSFGEAMPMLKYLYNEQRKTKRQSKKKEREEEQLAEKAEIDEENIIDGAPGEIFTCRICKRVPPSCVVLDLGCGGLVGCESCVFENYTERCSRCQGPENYQVLTTSWEAILATSFDGELESPENSPSK